MLPIAFIARCSLYMCSYHMFYPCGTCLGRTCKVLMYFVIPIAYLRRVFECMYWVPLSVFWSTDDRSMVFLWLFSRFPPPGSSSHKRSCHSLHFWSYCVFIQICECVVAGMCMCKIPLCVPELSPVPCTLYKPCLWASLWCSQQEIPAVWNSPRFAQWKSKP